MKTTQKGLKRNGRSRGFTLTQLLFVTAFIAILSAVLLGVFQQSRSSAQRSQCDMRLKAIVMGLDAFRQENGTYPENIQDLVDKKYLTDSEMLSCPSDPRADGSYDDFYVLRSKRDSGELPIITCSLCEAEGGQGIQAFKGRYTKQFATRPAELTAALSTTIERPGKAPISGKSGMQLRGGDTIRTSDGGQAIIRFADGSISTLQANTEITVLQSFIAGNVRAPLYTLIYQKSGDVLYNVQTGSKFDVTTPTATAGALGTEFQIKTDGSDNWWLKVLESKVYCSNLEDKIIVTPQSGTVNTGNLTQTDDWVHIGDFDETTPEETTPEETTPVNDPETPGNSDDDDDDDDDDKVKKKGNGWNKRSAKGRLNGKNNR